MSEFLEFVPAWGAGEWTVVGLILLLYVSAAICVVFCARIKAGAGTVIDTTSGSLRATRRPNRNILRRNPEAAREAAEAYQARVKHDAESSTRLLGNLWLGLAFKGVFLIALTIILSAGGFLLLTWQYERLFHSSAITVDAGGSQSWGVEICLLARVIAAELWANMAHWVAEIPTCSASIPVKGVLATGALKALLMIDRAALDVGGFLLLRYLFLPLEIGRVQNELLADARKSPDELLEEWKEQKYFGPGLIGRLLCALRRRSGFRAMP